MVRVKSYYISLDNSTCTYFSGQTISGKVHLILEEELNVEGIFLVLEGIAFVKWMEKRPLEASLRRRKLSNNMVRRRDSHIYFQFEITLLRAQDDDETTTLKPGEYEYPFSRILPSDLPSSFEGDNGYIRYTCSSNISVPWKIDPKCKVAFTIMEVLDLNTLPGIEKPCGGQSAKTLGMLCFKSGTITAAMSLDKQGYVPGENINIQAAVSNSTDADISDTAATLICVITYRSGIYTKLEKKEICQIKKGITQPQSKIQWTDQKLLIPPVPPTRVASTLIRIINLDYFIEFTVDPDGVFAKDLQFTVPITIGSIPLKKDFNRFVRVENAELSGSDNFNPPLLANYPNLPTFSYEEGQAVNIADENDVEGGTVGQLNYAPRYICYRQQTANQL